MHVIRIRPSLTLFDAPLTNEAPLYHVGFKEASKGDKDSDEKIVLGWEEDSMSVP
jgi:hypothetical protein